MKYGQMHDFIYNDTSANLRATKISTKLKVSYVIITFSVTNK